MIDPDGLPPEAWIVALLTLPGMGPSRLNALLGCHSGAGIWELLCSGGPLELDRVKGETVDKWRVAARGMSVQTHWYALKSLGIMVHERNSTIYPSRLRDDLEPPQVLFSLGLPIPPGPTVGIVGTRRCTSYGRRCAFELGAALAEAGVCVVSGLALGIDAAAHHGALSVTTATRGIPIGVVGSGLDVIYPRQNRELWGNVADRGALFSETPPGVGPEPWRFPARNRIIAGLSDALIVVESHERGGSLLTVDEALVRDVPVGVVPGPITSNAAEGSNRLLVDGATPILDADDVLAMIGHTRPRDVERSKDDVSSTLLDVLGWTPLSFDQLCLRISLPPAQVAAELEELVNTGLCARSGPWIERVK
ncbi:MAG: DNA processing protein [Verrucomicrobiales bacterium]|jgi:DNA processing protein